MAQVRTFARVSDNVVLSLGKDLAREFTISVTRPDPPEALNGVFGPDTFFVGTANFHAPDINLTIEYIASWRSGSTETLSLVGVRSGTGGDRARSQRQKRWGSCRHPDGIATC